ncbi:MAG: hypothetical protein ABIK92_13045 [Pseudomonadota bacterium]
MKQYQSMDLNELEAELKHKLHYYRTNVINKYINIKKKLKNHVSKYGKPLKESTLKTYRNYVKNIRTERDRYSNMFFKDIIAAIKMRRNGPLFSAEVLNKYKFLNGIINRMNDLAEKDISPVAACQILLKDFDSLLIEIEDLKIKEPVLNLDDFRMRRKNTPKAL